MSQRRPLVLKDGFVQELPSGDTVAGASAAHTVGMTNANASSIVRGAPVYVSAAGAVDLAQADADATSKVLGLVADASVSAAASANIQTDGVLTGSTGEWDAVAGTTGGLTAGAQYILDPDNAGQIVERDSTIDSGEWMVPIGTALSTTELLIDIEDGVKRA